VWLSFRVPAKLQEGQGTTAYLSLTWFESETDRSLVRAIRESFIY
jgi:hypothetical protein